MNLCVNIDDVYSNINQNFDYFSVTSIYVTCLVMFVSIYKKNIISNLKQKHDYICFSLKMSFQNISEQFVPKSKSLR